MKVFIEKTAEYFKALGDATRLKIIKMLASNNDNSFCVNDIANSLNITQSAVSQHLRVLRNIGLVKAKKQGIYVYYIIDIDAMAELKNDIDMLYEMAFKKCNMSCNKCSK